jgi:two-component system nitrogen regulation response regulator NtrX
MSQRILIVDDERNIRRTFEMVLRADGHEPLSAASGEEALQILADQEIDMVILDVRLPGMDGLAVLRAIKEADPERVVIMISGHGTIATAVEATQEGAFDFLEKPCSRERILLAVRNGLRVRSMGREVRRLRADQVGRHVLVSRSPAMATLREQIARVGPTNARVLIQGESGTGKELVARAIHEASNRREGPFVKVNCAAIPEELIESELFGAVEGAYTGATSSRDGKFLQADGGTLFLDEIGDMSLRAQAKVLRALQEGEIEKVGGGGPQPVDVRVLAATNKDLTAEVRAGRFREDLLFRLEVVPLRVMPLRERPEDVPLLAEHFLERYRLENNLPPRRLQDEAMMVLAQLAWPGNVRELQNAVERLVILSPGPEIGLEDLRGAGLLGRAHGGAAAPRASDRSAEPGADAAGRQAGMALNPAEIQGLGGLVEARRRFEAACIRRCLQESGGNVSQAARLLGIDRTNLHKKMQAYGIGSSGEPSDQGGPS